MADQYSSVRRVVKSLTSAEVIGDEHIVRLPIIMPTGSSATVRIISNGDRYFVGDMGLAYMQAESMGQKASFWRTADTAARDYDLVRDKTEIGVFVGMDDLFSAVCDVAIASWKVADTVSSKAEEAAVAALEETVTERLVRIFGKPKVRPHEHILGSSQSDWEFTAIVHHDNDTQTAFQAVGVHAQSIYKASTSFHDVSLLDTPPGLVAVTQDRQALGNRLGLLSQIAHVIEGDSADDVYRRAVA